MGYPLDKGGFRGSLHRPKGGGIRSGSAAGRDGGGADVHDFQRATKFTQGPLPHPARFARVLPPQAGEVKKQ